MPYDKFLYYYNDFQICYYYDHYNYSSQRYNTSPSKPTYLQFEVTQGGKYFITINQINRRFFAPEEKYAYTTINLIVAKKNGPEDYSSVGCVSKADKEMWIVSDLEPGHYVAYIESPWKRKVNQLTIASWGPAEVQFSVIPGDEIPKTLVKECMIEQIRKEGKPMKKYTAQRHPDIGYRFQNCNDSFGYFYYENDS